MDKPGIYLDETILRQTNNMRNLAYRLGMRLVEEGDKKRAIEVLDKAVAMMPQENVPYNQLLLALAQTYYAADAPEKGDDLVKRVSTEYTQKHRYFSSFKGTNKYQQVSSEVDEANQILGYAVNIAQTNNRKELADELQKQFENTVAGK
jgi:tetratricopeptide (TPR) repeat protein